MPHILFTTEKLGLGYKRRKTGNIN